MQRDAFASGKRDNTADARRGATRRDRHVWARAASSPLTIAQAMLGGVFLALTQICSVGMGKTDRIMLSRSLGDIAYAVACLAPDPSWAEAAASMIVVARIS